LLLFDFGFEITGASVAKALGSSVGTGGDIVGETRPFFLYLLKIDDISDANLVSVVDADLL